MEVPTTAAVAVVEGGLGDNAATMAGDHGLRAHDKRDGGIHRPGARAKTRAGDIDSAVNTRLLTALSISPVNYATEFPTGLCTHNPVENFLTMVRGLLDAMQAPQGEFCRGFTIYVGKFMNMDGAITSLKKHGSKYSDTRMSASRHVWCSCLCCVPGLCVPDTTTTHWSTEELCCQAVVALFAEREWSLFERPVYLANQSTCTSPTSVTGMYFMIADQLPDTEFNDRPGQPSAKFSDAARLMKAWWSSHGQQQQRQPKKSQTTSCSADGCPTLAQSGCGGMCCVHFHRHTGSPQVRGQKKSICGKAVAGTSSACVRAAAHEGACRARAAICGLAVAGLACVRDAEHEGACRARKPRCRKRKI